MTPDLATLRERIATKVANNDRGCWEWRGYIDRHGYGHIGVGSESPLVHRVSYIAFRGVIPEGLVIDHLCRNRRCVNPNHLEPVTAAENQRRGFPATKTECKNGHPYDEKNTYRRPGTNGQRDCRRCAVDRARRYRGRKAA